MFLSIMLFSTYKVFLSPCRSTPFYLVTHDGLSAAGPWSLAAHTFTHPRAKMSLVSSLNRLGFQVLWDLRRRFYIHSMITLMDTRDDEKAYLVEILTSSFWTSEVGIIMASLSHQINTFNVFGGQETFVHLLKGSKSQYPLKTIYYGWVPTWRSLSKLRSRVLHLNCARKLVIYEPLNV